METCTHCYTLDTLRNMADHLFDTSTGYQTGPQRAAKVAPCSLVYSTLRPTAAFLYKVHTHIKHPYLLMSDVADGAITHSHETNALLASPNLWHWWGVDNEVLDEPKIDSLPLGVMDTLELGVRQQSSSVDFHANVSISWETRESPSEHGTLES